MVRYTGNNYDPYLCDKIVTYIPVEGDYSNSVDIRLVDRYMSHRDKKKKNSAVTTRAARKEPNSGVRYDSRNTGYMVLSPYGCNHGNAPCAESESYDKIGPAYSGSEA